MQNPKQPKDNVIIVNLNINFLKLLLIINTYHVGESLDYNRVFDTYVLRT